MKGFLHKTEQGWVVRYDQRTWQDPSIEDGELPLHPDDVKEIEEWLFENHSVIYHSQEVEFEIVDFTYTVNNTPFSFKCAKLINQVPDVKKMVEDEIIDWIDNEILLNEQYKDSPRLKEGATMVKVHIQSLKQFKPTN